MLSEMNKRRRIEHAECSEAEAIPRILWKHMAKKRDDHPAVPPPPLSKFSETMNLEKLPANPNASSGPGLHFGLYGISLAWLSAFSISYDLMDRETWWVVEFVIKPLTAERRCRFTELPELKGYVGQAHTFASHAWAGLWGDLIAGLKHGLDSDTSTAFIDCVAITQHGGSGVQDDLSHLPDVIGSIACMTIVWNPLFKYKSDISFVQRSAPESAALCTESQLSFGPSKRCWCRPNFLQRGQMIVHDMGPHVQKCS